MAFWNNFGKFLAHLLAPGIGTAAVSYSDNQGGMAKPEEDKWYTKAVKGLNMWLNPEHAWFEYDDWNKQGDAFMAKQTGSDLTPAEKAANQFTADEAQKQRDWEEYMSNTSYQRQVKDMQAAGVNPAMAMQSASGASTPSGSAATSVAPQSGMSLSDLMALIMMPMQKRLMQSQAQMYSDQGKAALINAGAAQQNAGTNERNAATNERNAKSTERGLDIQQFNAETERMRAQIEGSRVANVNSLNDEQKNVLAQQAAYLKLQREQLPKQLAIAEKNADSQAKQVIASLRQADAAVQNAATNDRLSDYETSLKYAQETLTWYQADGQKVIAQNLPERTRVEIDNLIKEGVRLDAQGRLINKTGHLVDAQTVKTYVNCATDVSNAVNKWINPLSGASLPTASDWFTSNSVGAGAGVQMFGGM